MKLFKHSRKQRGFTLIELMVVVLIIAVLAALIVPRILSRQDEAKNAKASADISTLSSLLQQFRLDTDRFPTTEESINALMQQPADVEGWKGPYSDKPLPNDPWGTPYEYQYPGANGEDTFFLGSAGKDRQPGTEDDITNGDI